MNNFDRGHNFKVIRHVFGFGIEFLENKDIGIFGHLLVIDFIKRYSCHMYFSPISTSWFRRFGTVCIDRKGKWRIFENYSVISALFPLKLCVLFEEGILGTQVQKDAVPPIFISKNPITLRRIWVLSYLCLLLTKVLFETSFKSFQYNTEGRRLLNYSIKLILCSHYRSRCKGLCQNKKHEFDQYTKGGHFCKWICSYFTWTFLEIIFSHVILLVILTQWHRSFDLPILRAVIFGFDFWIWRVIYCCYF